MSLNKILFSSAAMTALLGSTAAIADVTAQDVWDDWKANMALYGDSGITVGSETYSGGILTITDLGMSIDDPNQGTTVIANMPEIVFTEQSDGTVLVTTAETYSFSVESEDNAGMRGSLNQQGLEIIVSGSPEELTYDMTAQRYAFSLDEVTEAGQVVPITVSFAMNGMDGQYVVRPGDLREVDYQINADTTDMIFDIVAPEDDLVMNLSGQIADLGLSASMVVPSNLDFENPEMISLAGMSVDVGYTFGELAYIFNFTERGDATSGTVQANGGMLDLTVNESEVAYLSAVDGVVANVQVAGFPFPIALTAETYGGNFAMPLGQTEEPAAFAMGINLVNLGVNDEIWMLGDPAGQLPHDPVTAQIGLSGTAKWLFDIFDPAQQMAMAQSDMPLEPHSLQIDVLNIDALGLQVTGEGGFTFDNEAPGPIPGMPKPEGRISLEANGVNSLLDTLVAMGMIPQEEIMGVRMMMGMFATASGNDSLSSSLEINAAGHVIVNGQRIQ